MDAAANRHQPALLLFWSLASGTAAYVALEQRRVPPDLVLLLVSCLFTGWPTRLSLQHACTVLMFHSLHGIEVFLSK
jgi:hypothetical protein